MSLEKSNNEIAQIYLDYIKKSGIDSTLVNNANVKSVCTELEENQQENNDNSKELKATQQKDNYISIELEAVCQKDNNSITDTIRVRISDDKATVVHDKKIAPATISEEEEIYHILRETRVTEFNLKDEELTILSGKLTQTIKQSSLETPSPLLADINSIMGLNCAFVDIFNHHRSAITKDVYEAKGIKSLKDGLENAEICLKSPQKQKKL